MKTGSIAMTVVKRMFQRWEQVLLRISVWNPFSYSLKSRSNHFRQTISRQNDYFKSYYHLNFFRFIFKKWNCWFSLSRDMLRATKSGIELILRGSFNVSISGENEKFYIVFHFKWIRLTKVNAPVSLSFIFKE